MKAMYEHLTTFPAEGVKSVVNMFKLKGVTVGPKRIRRLLRLMCRETIYRRVNLTKSGKREYIKPYLLKHLQIERSNQVWCTDITYIPMPHGFMYLTAYMDVYSRKITGWGLSNTMTVDWCLEVMEQAIAKHGNPAIINSDQGCQYTSAKWHKFMNDRSIKISMDGKGRALDNVWIERFWSAIKYNHIYLNPVEDVLELWKGIDRYIRYYNNKIHQGTNDIPAQRHLASVKSAA